MKSYFFLVGILILALWSTACEDDSAATNTRTGTVPRAQPTGEQNPEPGFFETYEATDRGIWQRPDLVIDFLGNLEGKTVADIGAGTGFITKRIVPNAGKVIAIDIDQRFIDYLDSLKTEFPAELQDRFETRLGRPDNPMLNDEEVDEIMIINTYMYIENRVDYLRTIKRGLKPGGKLLIIDFKKKKTPVGPPSEIRTPLYRVEEELTQAGFYNISSNDSALSYQYIVMAEKAPLQ